MVLLLLTFCLLLLPLWESVIVLCFVVRYFISILVLQSSWWGRESWLLCLICLPGVSWWLSGSSSRCQWVVCSLWLWYFLIILTYYFLFKRLLSVTLVSHFYYTRQLISLVSVSKNSKWVWSGNTTITNCRQPRGTARKSRSKSLSTQWATLVTHHYFRAHIFYKKCWNQTFSMIVYSLTFYLFDDIKKILESLMQIILLRQSK